MKFSSTPVSTMYAKVYEKKRPYSQEVQALLLCVSDSKTITKSGAMKLTKAFAMTELPLETETNVICSHVESLMKRYNFSNAKLEFAYSKEQLELH
jgi:hypothetical protein